MELRWFTRATAVFVGLANLAAVVWLGNERGFRGNDVGWDVLPVTLALMLAVVLTGLATSEIMLRRFGPSSLLAPGFAPRYNVVVFAVGLGGALTGGLLAFSYTVMALFTEPLAMNVLEGVLRALIPALLGAVAGFGLGLVEGAVLALPLAAILGRIGSGDHRSMDGANQS